MLTTAMGLLEPLTVAESDDLNRYEQQITEGVAGFIAVGAALLEIRERRLYRASHRNFADYLDVRWPQIGTRRQADRLINAAAVEENLRPIGLSLTSESQGRALAGLPPEQQREAFQAATSAAGDKPPTAAQVAQAAGKVAPAPTAPPLTTQGDYPHLKSCRDCGSTAYLNRIGYTPENRYVGVWLCEPCMTAGGLIYQPNQLSPADRARRLGGELEFRAGDKKKLRLDAYVLVFPGQKEQVFLSRRHQPDEGLVAAIALIESMERFAPPPANAPSVPKPPLLISKFEADLIDRAAKLGYTVKPHGNGYRITKGDVPRGGAKNPDELVSLIKDWELDARLNATGSLMCASTPQRPPPARPTCKHCGYQGQVMIGAYCESCYSLTQAQQWQSGSDDMRWRLKHALSSAQAMPEPLRSGRIAEIRDYAAAHDIDLDAPIIEAPIAEAEAVTPAAPASRRAVLAQHAESVWSGLIERSSPEELRVLHCLLLAEPSAPDEDVADEIWKSGCMVIGNMFEPDLEWIKMGTPEIAQGRTIL